MTFYYRVRVDLDDVRPPIWRRFLLEASGTFADLHGAIQDACGWMNCHLHRFQRQKSWAQEHVISHLSTPDDDDPAPDSSQVRLSSVFGTSGSTTIFYMYDYGDGWVHRVHVEDRLELDLGLSRQLIAGARSFPPEDSGGVGGYAELLRILAKPKSRTRDEKEMLEWLAEFHEGWEPDAFELEAARRSFDRPLKRSTRRRT